MPIKLYDSLDEVPEPLREAAVETKDGKYAAEDRDEIGVLKSTLDKERREKQELERKQREREQELARLQAESNARREGATEQEIEKRRKEIEDATKPLRDQNAALEQQLNQVLHLDRVRALGLAAGILPDRIDDAMLILERRTGLTDDKKGLVVKDKDGSISATRVEDFLARDFKTEKPWLYAGTGTSGSGTRPGGSPPPSADRAARIAEQREAEQRAVVSSAF